MDDDNVRAEQLLYQMGELGAQLTNAEFADVPLDKRVVARLLQEAKAVYDASVRLVGVCGEKQAAKAEEEMKYEVSTELLLSPCVDKRQCRYMWDAAKTDPAVKELVRELRELKSRLSTGTGASMDMTAQRVVELMKRLESHRPQGATNSPYSMCLMSGFPCAISLIERKTGFVAPKCVLPHAAMTEAARMLHYAKVVTRKYVIELEAAEQAGVQLEGGALTFDPRALTAAAVYLEGRPEEALEAVQSFYALLPLPGATRLRALHKLETAQSAPESLHAFLLSGGVTEPLQTHVPYRAQSAARRHYDALWKTHLLHFMGPIPKYSYDAAGDRVHIVVQ